MKQHQNVLPDELWKATPQYDSLYEVSDRGRVRSLTRTVRDSKGRTRTLPGRELRPSIGRYVSVSVSLSKKGTTRSFRVHQLVLGAFVGTCPKGMECCHRNGVRTDNRLENLRYDTRKGNEADKKVHGTSNQGERHGLAILTENEVVRLRRLRASGSYTLKELAEMFGVSEMTISDIVNFKSWQCAGGPKQRNNHDCRLKLTPEAVCTICRLAAKGISQSKLAKRFGVHQSTISRIVCGKLQ